MSLPSTTFFSGQYKPIRLGEIPSALKKTVQQSQKIQKITNQSRLSSTLQNHPEALKTSFKESTCDNKALYKNITDTDADDLYGDSDMQSIATKIETISLSNNLEASLR